MRKRGAAESFERKLAKGQQVITRSRHIKANYQKIFLSYYLYFYLKMAEDKGALTNIQLTKAIELLSSKLDSFIEKATANSNSSLSLIHI